MLNLNKLFNHVAEEAVEVDLVIYINLTFNDVPIAQKELQKDL